MIKIKSKISEIKYSDETITVILLKIAVIIGWHEFRDSLETQKKGGVKGFDLGVLGKCGMSRLLGGLEKHLAKNTNANYNPVAEAEAILASEGAEVLVG